MEHRTTSEAPKASDPVAYEAESSIEIEFTITAGSWEPAEADTGTPAGWSDLAVDQVFVSRTTYEKSPNGFAPVRRKVNLLAGLSEESRDILRENILEAFGPGAASDELSALHGDD